MEAKTVISFSPEERAAVASQLPSLALAFPHRDEEGDEDSEMWRALRKLLQPDMLFDQPWLDRIALALAVARQRLSERSSVSWWRQEIGELPSLGTPPEKVLAEAAQQAVRNLDQLEELVGNARAICGLALPA